jgi:hypothetical protein
MSLFPVGRVSRRSLWHLAAHTGGGYDQALCGKHRMMAFRQRELSEMLYDDSVCQKCVMVACRMQGVWH